MCGLFGFFETDNRFVRAQLHAFGQNMAACLHHRGPDGEGLWQDPDVPLLLGHRRLAIIDLTDDGAQPMVSASERYVISFNGEIYNFKALRAELEGVGAVFHGRSDTEVMLTAIDEWGLNSAVQKFDGMFAFALWDRKNKELHLIRDRLGKKPLYLGWARKALVFSSELKALHQHPSFHPKVNRQALSLFMHYGYIPAPYSIYENIWQLLPGHRIVFDLSNPEPGQDLADAMAPYWSMKNTIEEARQNISAKADEEIIEEFHDLLESAVAARMISDVPLGAMLSGGLDSSMVVALMQKISDRPVKTFSIGFREDGFDEASFARQVASHLGTDHHELYLEPEQAMDIIPMLPDMYDEPFADVSQIPTFLVSRFAREQVTVALSGDGGDELLGGYNRHFVLPSLWRRTGWLPHGVRKAMGGGISSVSPQRWNRLVPQHPQFGQRMHKVAGLLSEETAEEAYLSALRCWQGADRNVVKGALSDMPVPLMREEGQIRELSFAEKMMYGDALSYLPNDVLTKVDRASMAVSLEVRSPLLDHHLFEYCWSLPLSMKIRNGKGKWLLRQVLSRYVPDSHFERPKQGFTVPLGSWLRGPLKEWADDLLSDEALQVSDVFDAGIVQRVWDEHQSGAADRSNMLWSALMYQSWARRWL